MAWSSTPSVSHPEPSATTTPAAWEFGDYSVAFWRGARLFHFRRPMERRTCGMRLKDKVSANLRPEGMEPVTGRRATRVRSGARMQDWGGFTEACWRALMHDIDRGLWEADWMQRRPRERPSQRPIEEKENSQSHRGRALTEWVCDQDMVYGEDGNFRRFATLHGC